MPARKKARAFLGIPSKGPSTSPSGQASSEWFGRARALFNRDKSSREPSPAPSGSAPSHTLSGLPPVNAPHDSSVALGASEPAVTPTVTPVTLHLASSNQSPTNTQPASGTTVLGNIMPGS